MGSKDDGLSAADKVAESAEGLAAALEDSGQSGALVGVTEGDNGDDTVLNGARKLASCQVRDLSSLTASDVSQACYLGWTASLPVARDDDFGIWAAVSLGGNGIGHSGGASAGSTGKVASNVGRIADAGEGEGLASAREGGGQGRREGRANDSAKSSRFSCSTRKVNLHAGAS